MKSTTDSKIGEITITAVATLVSYLEGGSEASSPNLPGTKCTAKALQELLYNSWITNELKTYHLPLLFRARGGEIFGCSFMVGRAGEEALGSVGAFGGNV